MVDMTNSLLVLYQCHKAQHLDMQRSIVYLSMAHTLQTSHATLIISRLHPSDGGLNTLIDHIVRSNIE